MRNFQCIKLNNKRKIEKENTMHVYIEHDLNVELDIIIPDHCFALLTVFSVSPCSNENISFAI